MSKHQWCSLHRPGALITLAMLILGANGLAVLRQREFAPVPSVTARGDSSSVVTTPPVWAPAPFARKREPGDYSAACDHPKDREEADLCQQWRAADAAYRAVQVAKDQSIWNWVQLISAVATIAAAMFAALASRAAQRSVEQTAKELEFSYPPRLRVVQVTMKIEPNSRLKGICYVVNEGRHAAVIESKNPEMRAKILIDWREGNLPQRHLLWDHDETDSVCLHTTGDTGVILPGDTAWWEFNSRDRRLTAEQVADLERNGKLKLYVVGLIRYGDTHDTERGNFRTLFGRCYNSESDRFKHVADDYYEYSF